MPGRVRFLDQVPIGFYDTDDSNSGGNPGGPTGSIQYNYSGSLSGSSNMVWDDSTNTLILNGNIDTNNINVSQSFTASGLIYPTADNGEESFMQTDGDGNLSLQYVKTIYEEIVNGELTQLVKGTPVYVSGSQGAASIVYRADAADPAKMPVIYITADTLSPGEKGRGIALGLIKGVNTTGYPAGTEIYVNAGGGWTPTRPTGDKIVQVLGYVTKEGNGGQGVVLNPGPANLPNIPSGNVWTGNSESFPIPVPISSLSVATASFALTASFVDTASTNAFIQGGNSFGTTATLGTNDNQSLAFETSGSTRMFISSSGNVGIGTVTPSQSLHVVGSILIGNYAASNSLLRFANVSTVDNSAFIGQGASSGFEINPGSVSEFRIQNPTGANTARINIQGNGVSIASFYRNARVRIGNAAFTNPTATLEVRGDSATTGTAFLVQNSTPSNLFTVLNNGAVSAFSFYSDDITTDRILNLGGVPSPFRNLVGIGTNKNYPRFGTTGNNNYSFYSTDGYNPTSGAGSFTAFFYGGTINQTGGANGIARGLFINPTLTSAADFRAIENTVGNNLLNSTSGNTYVGLSSNDGSARLQVRGSGATSATTALRVENSNASASLVILDNNTVGIGRTPTSSLDIAGTTRISGSFNTATSGSILTVIGSGSAQPIFTVQGSQGELFSVTDSLSGSLFSVNDISGLPILEVFSDNTTLIGSYLDPMLITTTKITQTNSGSFVVYSLPTASYDTAFFEYSVKSGSNARAGTIMAIQSGTTASFTEITSSNIGNTSDISFTVIVSGSNIALTGSSTTGSWTIKTIIRGI